jgi:tRNA(Ile)-lysidine synthase
MEKEAFIERITSFARDHELWQRGDRILAAVSGGPDSLGLLFLFHEIAEKEGLFIGCCCVDHHMRKESAAETRFVEGVCRDLGVPCRICQAYVPQVAKEKGGSLETVGRELRYQALYETADMWNCQWIATAHHKNDQAETVLYHLLRGSGMTGLSGIHPKRGRIIRPFLPVTKKEIGEFVSHYPYEPCHDATNDMAITTRNHIRLELLPELEKYNPQIVNALSNTAEIIRTEDEVMEAEAEKWIASNAEWAGPILTVPASRLKKEPLAMERRILRALAGRVRERDNQYGATLAFDAVERFRHLLHEGHTGSMTSAAGVLMTLACGMAWFETGSTRAGQKRTPPEFELTQEVLKSRPDHLRRDQFLLDADRVGPIRLIHGNGNEMFHPRGLDRPVRLKKCMQDLKIPSELRNAWPLAADEQHIYWIGFLRGSQYGLPDKNTTRYLLLTLRRKNK